MYYYYFNIYKYFAYMQPSVAFITSFEYSYYYNCFNISQSSATACSAGIFYDVYC